MSIDSATFLVTATSEDDDGYQYNGMQTGRGDSLVLGGANTPATGAPTITGTAQVGETLTADTSGISDADGLDDAVFGYQWLADGIDISGATGSTYTLADADESKAIKVKVSFTDDAGHDETLTSAAIAAVTAAPTSNNPSTGALTISGTAQVGETLTADSSGIAYEDGLENADFTYQWLAHDTEITGVTGSTYTLDEADAGKSIKVRVSFTDDAGNAETLTSGATDAVAAVEPLGPPARPTGLSGEASHDAITLTRDDPRGRQHHRLRHPAAQPRYRRRGRVHQPGAGYGQRGDQLHRRQRGGRDPLHLPDPSDQRSRDQ